MSKIENEIDVFLPRNPASRAMLTKTGLDLVEAVDAYLHEKYSYDDTRGESFGSLDVSSDYGIREISELLNGQDWEGERITREYYQTVSFPVLQAFAHRICRFIYHQFDWGRCFDTFLYYPMLGGGIDSGIERIDGKVMIWFVKYGAGRFAVDLKDLSDETAKDFGFLGGPKLYTEGMEDFELCRRGIYPIADVAANRLQHSTNCLQEFWHEYSAKRGQLLEKHWKRNNKNVLPTELIKVNWLPSNAEKDCLANG